MPLRGGMERELARLQGSAGFDEMDPLDQAIAFGRGQRVARQSAAPWAKLDLVDRLVAPGANPQIGQPQPDELAEHLADFRRGDKIARSAERIAG